jgi:hypothetical protein
LVNVTGKWVLEKGQLTHVFAMSEEFLAVQLDLPMRSAMVVSFLRRSAVAALAAAAQRW